MHFATYSKPTRIADQSIYKATNMNSTLKGFALGINQGQITLAFIKVILKTETRRRVVANIFSILPPIEYRPFKQNWQVCLLRCIIELFQGDWFQ